MSASNLITNFLNRPTTVHTDKKKINILKEEELKKLLSINKNENLLSKRNEIQKERPTSAKRKEDLVTIIPNPNPKILDIENGNILYEKQRRVIYQFDNEYLLDSTLHLKRSVNSLKLDNNQLRGKINVLIAQINEREKRIDELSQVAMGKINSKRNYNVKNFHFEYELKRQLAEAKKEKGELELQIWELKKNIKYTNNKEYSIENTILQDECIRLRKMCNELSNKEDAKNGLGLIKLQVSQDSQDNQEGKPDKKLKKENKLLKIEINKLKEDLREKSKVIASLQETSKSFNLIPSSSNAMKGRMDTLESRYKTIIIENARLKSENDLYRKEIKPKQDKQDKQDESKSYIQETESRIKDFEIQIKELNNKYLILAKSNEELIKENEELKLKLKQDMEQKASENKIINLIPFDEKNNELIAPHEINDKEVSPNPNLNMDLMEEIKDNGNLQKEAKNSLINDFPENTETNNNQNQNQIIADDLPSPISNLYPSHLYSNPTIKMRNKIPDRNSKDEIFIKQWSTNEIVERIKSFGESKANQTYTESILNIQYHLQKNKIEIEKYTNYNKHFSINTKGEKVMRSSSLVDLISELNYFEFKEDEYICLIYKLSSASSGYQEIQVNTLISEFKRKSL